MLYLDEGGCLAISWHDIVNQDWYIERQKQTAASVRGTCFEQPRRLWVQDGSRWTLVEDRKQPWE